MKTTKWKHIGSLFFLFTFLFLRIVDAHAFSHITNDDQEDQTHCELCEIITVSNQLTPLIDNADSEIKPKPFIIVSDCKILIGYKTTDYSITLPKYIYNKPPPTL